MAVKITVVSRRDVKGAILNCPRYPTVTPRHLPSHVGACKTVSLRLYVNCQFWRYDMPKRTPILPSADLADEYALKMWLASAVVDGHMTRNQWRAILELLTPKLPVRTHGMACRTPKGVLYLFLTCPHRKQLATYRMSPRAEWYHGGLSDEEFRVQRQMATST